jgi:hypothetical protein
VQTWRRPFGHGHEFHIREDAEADLREIPEEDVLFTENSNQTPDTRLLHRFGMSLGSAGTGSPMPAENRRVGKRRSLGYA